MTGRRRAGPTPFKVALVTDIGGLNDRSFNFLANKGLQAGEDELGVEGTRLHLEVERGLHPEPHVGGAADDSRPRHLGRLPDGRRDAQVAKRFPNTKFAIIDYPASPAELKGKPTNVRGLLFKEQEAGYLVGYLAALAAKNGPNGAGVIAAVGGLKIPPVDRFIAGYYQGAKEGVGRQ